MASTLRVDPEQLRTVAAAQVDVSAYVSTMGAGRSLTAVVQSMAGLQSATASLVVGAVLDEVARQISSDLATHADRLVSAADRYCTADDELAGRLRRIAD